jgi:hypothetical protein
MSADRRNRPKRSLTSRHSGQPLGQPLTYDSIDSLRLSEFARRGAWFVESSGQRLVVGFSCQCPHKLVALCAFVQIAQKLRPIFIVAENLFPSISPCHDMMHRTGPGDTKRGSEPHCRFGNACIYACCRNAQYAVGASSNSLSGNDTLRPIDGKDITHLKLILKRDSNAENEVCTIKS